MIKNIIIIFLLATCVILSTALIRQNIERRKEVLSREEARRYKVAIVIDDLGYNTRNLGAIFSIKRPITLSILPNLSYSGYISNAAQERGLEAILHLPLEPHEEDGYAPSVEDDTIYCDMEEEEVLSRLDDFLDSVPAAKGVSNHMGSKATENASLMAVIFEEMRKRNLYFLDSLVTPKSVCEGLAKRMDLRYTRRDVFLDNENDPAYIKGQLLELSRIAIRNGYAIGVGHDRALTISTIKEIIPEFEKKGIEFVFVSDLVK